MLRVNASNSKILLTVNIRRKKLTAHGSMVSLHLYFILQFLVQLINLLDFGFICVTVILMNQRMYDVIVHFQLGFCLLPSFGFKNVIFSFLMRFTFCCYN